MKLYGTYPSHFTRKVRVVLQELSLKHEFVVVERLMETGQEHFAGNPLHQIPVLEDGERRLVESDLICEYLWENYGGRQSSFALFPDGDITLHKQRLAIMNGGMAAGVKLIRARRSGISWDYPFFRQEEAALKAALSWLNHDLNGRLSFGQKSSFSLLDATLVCFTDWAVFREMIPSLQPYPHLERFSAHQGARASLAATHPLAAGGK